MARCGHVVSRSRYIFIHIPTNGGTAVQRRLEDPSCTDIEGGAHRHTVSNVVIRGQISIVVIRDPVSRMYSAYLHSVHETGILAAAAAAPELATVNFSGFIRSLAKLRGRQHHQSTSTHPP